MKALRSPDGESDAYKKSKAAGYATIVEDGWIVRVYVDGHRERIEYIGEGVKIDTKPRLMLTWQDCRKIVKIADHIITKETGKYKDEQEYYEEVLKRYEKGEEYEY